MITPDDHYELFEVDAPRGAATPLHRTGWAKAYYVLHGRMIVQVEDEAFDLGPGSSITVPPEALPGMRAQAAGDLLRCVRI